MTQQGFTDQHAHVRLGTVALHKKKPQVISTLLFYPQGYPTSLANLMGAAELFGLACLVRKLSKQETICTGFSIEEHGIDSTTCPCNSIDSFQEYNDLYVLIDRPIIPYYISHMRRKGRARFIEAYQEFYTAIKEANAIAYSVTTVSRHKTIMVKNIEQWMLKKKKKTLELISNKDVYEELQSTLEDLPSWVLPYYDLTSEVIREFEHTLSSQRMGFTDYDILQPFFTSFEERSQAWKLNKQYSTTQQDDPFQFFQRHFPRTDFYFFYVNYFTSWTRVETTSSELEKVYAHYLLSTSFTKNYYPLPLQLAHNAAVIHGNMRKWIEHLSKRLLSSTPGTKYLSKYGWLK